MTNSDDARGTIVVYTDGSCIGNPGPGGWSYALQQSTIGVPNVTLEKSGYGGIDTTNNRMELTAVIEALKASPTGSNITLYTDSKYVQKGCTEWLSGWIKRGWKTAAKKPVLNQDLWEGLNALLIEKKPEIEWVRGHNGDPFNERADVLATNAARGVTIDTHPEVVGVEA